MCLSANKSSPTSNKSLHKVVVDWNKLPDDMLKLIVKHLAFPDFARFGSVCSSWRSLASVGLHLHHKGGRLPWLIVPYYDVVGQAPPANTRDNYCPDPALGFFSILDGAIHKVDIPELQGRRICGSSFGWLITVHGNSEFQLLRPFTGKVVNLPPLTTVFPDMVWDTNRMRNQYIYKVITSPNAESPIVIAIPYQLAMLLFYKPGEDNDVDDPFIWKKIRGGHVKGGSRQLCPIYSDITFYKGDLYALRCRGEVLYENTRPRDGQVRKAIRNAYQKSDGVMSNTVQELAALHALGLHNKMRTTPREVECYWTSPPHNFLKVKNDGCARRNPGVAERETMFRSYTGEVIGTLIGGLMVTTNYVAKSKAIARGGDKEGHQAWLDSNLGGIRFHISSKCLSENQVHLLVKEDWERIRTKVNIMITSTWREVNFRADVCAKKRASLPNEVKHWWAMSLQLKVKRLKEEREHNSKGDGEVKLRKVDLFSNDTEVAILKKGKRLPTSSGTDFALGSFPDNGGYVVWVDEAFGPFWGFQMGSLKFLIGVINKAAYLVLYDDYMKCFFPILKSGMP
ncbi:hypothetical protein IFM89_028858 [Coptis chinensis]|uniref:F-box domain-containing protein n=1 Tax=Coptis chinensis TaxID=261450 RepID=A0A835H7R4_9MAGN|nr:hypothetical protein IFM89_028858 [Coptis chinensis]